MPLGDFIFHERIGSGSFSDVYRVTRKVDNKQYVIKQIKLSSLSRNEQDMCIKECKLLAQFEHPYIVKYFESFISKESGGFLNIVMELAATNLGDYLIDRKNRKAYIEESEVWRLFLQTLLTLSHLHNKKVIHRDIKPANIFLDSSLNVKLGDFGVSKQLGNSSLVARTLVGTPYYLSPELCKNEPYTSKADIWALGCILYELIELRHPFQANNHAALIMKIVKGTFKPINSKRYSNELAYLINKCLQKDQNYRYTSSQLLSLSIIQEKGIKLGLYDLFPEKNRKKSPFNKAGGLKKNSKKNVIIPPLKIKNVKRRKSKSGSPNSGRKKQGNVSPSQIVVISPRKKRNHQMSVLSPTKRDGSLSPTSKKKLQLSPTLKKMISPRKKQEDNNNNNNNNRKRKIKRNNNTGHRKNQNLKKRKGVVPSQAKLGAIPSTRKGRAGHLHHNNNSSPPRRRVKIDPKIRYRNRNKKPRKYHVKNNSNNNNNNNNKNKNNNNKKGSGWRPNKSKNNKEASQSSKIIQEDTSDEDSLNSLLRGPSNSNITIVSNPFEVHKPLFSMKRRRQLNDEKKMEENQHQHLVNNLGLINKKHKRVKSNGHKSPRKKKNNNNNNHKNIEKKRKKGLSSGFRKKQNFFVEDETNKKKKLKLNIHSIQNNSNSNSNSNNNNNNKNKNRNKNIGGGLVYTKNKNFRNKNKPYNNNNSSKKQKQKSKLKQKSVVRKIRSEDSIHMDLNSSINDEEYEFKVIDESLANSLKSDNSEKHVLIRNSEDSQYNENDYLSSSSELDLNDLLDRNNNNNNNNNNNDNDGFKVQSVDDIQNINAPKITIEEESEDNENDNSNFLVNTNTSLNDTSTLEKKNFFTNNNNNNNNNKLKNLTEEEEEEDTVIIQGGSTKHLEELNQLQIEFKEMENKILDQGVSKIHFNDIFNWLRERPRVRNSAIRKFVSERIEFELERSHIIDSFHSLVVIDKNTKKILQKID